MSIGWLFGIFFRAGEHCRADFLIGRVKLILQWLVCVCCVCICKSGMYSIHSAGQPDPVSHFALQVD